MPDKITINMDTEFITWWNTTLMCGNETNMFIAWYGWQAHKELIKIQIKELEGLKDDKD